MTSLEERRELLQHLQWADASVWSGVLALGTPLDERLKGWLHHIHLVQRAFAHIWEGREVEMSEPGEFEDAASLLVWGQGAHRKLTTFLETVDEEALGQELAIPWTEQLTERFNQPISPVTLGQTMFQVVQHSTHHRGQVCSRLRELGGEPPMVDYILWNWLGQPEPQWPDP